MDFEEKKDQSHEINVKKNRATLIALFVIFFTPVTIAYLAYFNGWFSAATENRGELLVADEILDIEDFKLVRDDGKAISGAEFETLYWWLLPVDPLTCDQACLTLNLYMLNQTYVGLGKDSERINPLLVLPEGAEMETNSFPLAHSEFSQTGVKALEKSGTGAAKDLPANYFYLVDPLGHIILRYPLVKDKNSAPQTSKDLREDLRRLFKYSRLG